MRKFLSIWWLNPTIIYIAMTLIAFYACSISERSYWLLYGVRGKYVSAAYLIMYVLSAFLFCLGCKSAKTLHDVQLMDAIKLKDVYKYLLFVVVVAYGIWFVRFVSIHGLSNFFSFLKPTVLAAKASVFRLNSGRIPGITSMTEFGVVVAPLSVILFTISREKKYILHFLVLCILATIRAVLFSERLAIIEILTPSIIVFLALHRYRKLYVFLPIVAIVFLFVFFGVFEYSRSWSRYYVNVYHGTYAEFIINRVMGYYAIAVNTECTAITYFEPCYFPNRLLLWLWQFPLLNKVPDMISPDSNVAKLLAAYGNPEFNNPGGMLTAVCDFGAIGLVFSFFFGRIVGGVYKSFRKGGLRGMIFYPICFLALVELPRYFYFGNQRAFFVLVGMYIMYEKTKRNKIYSLLG